MSIFLFLVFLRFVPDFTVWSGVNSVRHFLWFTCFYSESCYSLKRMETSWTAVCVQVRTDAGGRLNVVDVGDTEGNGHMLKNGIKPRRTLITSWTLTVAHRSWTWVWSSVHPPSLLYPQCEICCKLNLKSETSHEMCFVFVFFIFGFCFWFVALDRMPDEYLRGCTFSQRCVCFCKYTI